MSERFRSSAHFIDAVRYDGDVIESRVKPLVPRELASFAPGQVVMVQVGQVTHGGPGQWIPVLLTTGTHSEPMKRGDYLTRDGRGLYHVLGAETMERCYEAAPSSVSPKCPTCGAPPEDDYQVCRDPWHAVSSRLPEEQNK